MGIIIFDGKASSDVGIHVSTAPGYESPTKIYESTEVPGKNGDILVPSGSYSNVEVKYNVSFYSGEKKETFYQMIAKIMEWLYANEGYRKLEDSYSPDYYRLGVCSSPIDVENILAQAGQFDLAFNCRPERFLKSGDNSSEGEITVSDIIDLNKIEGGYNIAHNTNGLDIDPNHDYWTIHNPNGGSVKVNAYIQNSYRYNEDFLNLFNRSKSMYFLTSSRDGSMSFYRSFYVDSGIKYDISFNCGPIPDVVTEALNLHTKAHIKIYNSNGELVVNDNFKESMRSGGNPFCSYQIIPNGSKITIEFVIDQDAERTNDYFINELMLVKYQEFNVNKLGPVFNEDDTYYLGDYVIYENNIYKCIVLEHSGSWISANFSRVSLSHIPWSMAKDEFWIEGSNLLLDTNVMKFNKLSKWSLVGDVGVLQSPKTLSGVTYRLNNSNIRQQIDGPDFAISQNLKIGFKYINLLKDSSGLSSEDKPKVVYSIAYIPESYQYPFGVCLDDYTSTEGNYPVGSYVVYDQKIYRANTENGYGRPFNPDYWDEVFDLTENGFYWDTQSKKISKTVYLPSTISTFSTYQDILQYDKLLFSKAAYFAVWFSTKATVNEDESDASLYISDIFLSPISINNTVEWTGCNKNIEIDADRAEQQDLIILYNPTRFESSPIIKVYGQYDYLGNISSPESKSELALIVNGYRIDIWKLDGELTIDGQLMDVYKGNTNYNMYVGFQNGFPKLDPGENIIKIELPDQTSYQGKTFKVEVIPKWWTL